MLGSVVKSAGDQLALADDACQAWHREDRGAIIVRMTKQGGPRWGAATRRVTVDMSTGKVIEDLHINGSYGLDMYRRIPKAPRDIKTTLYYRKDRSFQTDGTVFAHC